MTIPEVALSVVIVCLNEADFIAGCLASLGIREGDAVEIVVVDGGSTDDTLAAVRAWTQAQNGNTTVLIVRSPPGYGRQRNAGVAAARGTWVAFLSADVRVAEGWMATVLDRLADGTDLLIGGFELAPMPGRGRWMPALAPTLYPSVVGGAVERASTVHLIARCSALRCTPFDETLSACEDKELVFRLLRRERAGAAEYLSARPTHLARESAPRFLRKLYAEAAALARISYRYGSSFPDCFGWRAHALPAFGLLGLALAALLLEARLLAGIFAAASLARGAFHRQGLARNPYVLASPAMLGLHAAGMTMITLGYGIGTVDARIATRPLTGKRTHGQD